MRRTPQSIPVVIGALVLCGAAAPQSAVAGAAPPDLAGAVGVSTAETTDLQILDEVPGATIVATVVNGEPVTMLLSPYDLRSDRFELLVQDQTGTFAQIEAPPPSRTVRGSVLEWEGSVVAGSLVDGRLRASIRTARRGIWFIQPVPEAFAQAGPAAHLVYTPADVLPDDGHCGVEEDGRARPSGGDGTLAPRGTGPQVAEIAFDSDVEFFLQSGSIAATVDDIEGIMVAVDDIYRSQVGIRYAITRIVVRTAEPDPYTASDSFELRDQFRDEWEANFDPQDRDVAHLMTARTIDGSVIGRAFIGEICNRDGIIANGAYGFSRSRSSSSLARRVSLTAHELGHNWDATHCSDSAADGCGNYDSDCGIMCACIGQCTMDLLTFGSAARSDIISHRDSRDCLDPATLVNYVDAAHTGGENGTLSFPYNTLREGVWATDPGGTVFFFGGVYDADRTLEILNRPMLLKAQPGTGIVRIGQ